MSLATSDVKFLQDLIASRSGHVVTDQQSYLFDTKLLSLASSEGLETVEELVEKTRKTNSALLFDRITEAMTINETFFFRDMAPFEMLKDSILPSLIESRREKKELKIWGAACSTGQESYSIAITIREHFPELCDWRIRILATDLSDEVLEKAESGCYTQFEVNRGMPAKLLIKHFQRSGAAWAVNDQIRAMLEFKKVNLVNPWPIAEKFDVVFLRNVLIYFTPDTKKRILTRMRQNMMDDAYLVLGGGESMLNIDAPFKRDMLGQNVCFRPSN